MQNIGKSCGQGVVGFVDIYLFEISTSPIPSSVDLESEARPPIRDIGQDLMGNDHDTDPVLHCATHE